MPYPECPKCQHAVRHSGLVGCLEPACKCDLGPEQVANLLDAAEDQRDLTQKEGLAEGRALRDVGTEQAGDGAPAALVSAWKAQAETTLARLIAWGGEFSADDLVNGLDPDRLGSHDEIPEPAGEPPVPNMLGGLFLGAARGDRIQAVGFHQSVRPSARARVQRTWRGQVTT